MSQEQSFTSRVSRRATQQRKDAANVIKLEIKTELEREDEHGELVYDEFNQPIWEVTHSEWYSFKEPGEGRLLLLASSMGASSRDQDSAAEIMATFRTMLSPEQYRSIVHRLDDDCPVEKKIEMEALIELVGVLLEGFSEGFPTQPSSDSSVARVGTGGSSTGRVDSRASTRSPSRFRDS